MSDDARLQQLSFGVAITRPTFTKLLPLSGRIPSKGDVGILLTLGKLARLKSLMIPVLRERFLVQRVGYHFDKDLL